VGPRKKQIYRLIFVHGPLPSRVPHPHTRKIANLKVLVLKKLQAPRTSTAEHERYAPPSIIIIMSLRSFNRASNTLWSCRRAVVLLRSSHPTIRCLAQSQRRWASEKGKDDKRQPFYPQLFESIAARVQREKEEQQELIVNQQRTARGHYVATIFSMDSTPFESYSGYPILTMIQYA